VATLSEIAKSKKDNPRNGVHVKLRLAQGKLAERERRLTKFNARICWSIHFLSYRNVSRATLASLMTSSAPWVVTPIRLPRDQKSDRGSDP
jgi:hypothetical protein